MTIKHSKKKCLINGAISSEKIGRSIQNHQSKTDIGAHSIFLGQIRKDVISGHEVVSIEYSAYEEMAEEVFYNIREDAFTKFDLTCLHIYHSLGLVNVGEISLFVFTSSEHREPCMAATKYIVDEIKSKVPIFGKEILSNNTHIWKHNNPA